MMFLYTNRLKLVKMFKEWCEENKAAIDLYNMVVFLQSKNLLDEEKAEKFIKE